MYRPVRAALLPTGRGELYRASRSLDRVSRALDRYVQPPALPPSSSTAPGQAPAARPQRTPGPAARSRQADGVAPRGWGHRCSVHVPGEQDAVPAAMAWGATGARCRRAAPRGMLPERRSQVPSVAGRWSPAGARSCSACPHTAAPGPVSIPPAATLGPAVPPLRRGAQRLSGGSPAESRATRSHARAGGPAPPLGLFRCRAGAAAVRSRRARRPRASLGKARPPRPGASVPAWGWCR